MLESNKVRLRPLRKSDAKLFAEWFNDPEVTQFMQPYLPLTEMGEEKWIEQREKDKNSVEFVIENRMGTEPTAIGNCCLSNISWKDQCAEFGIGIGDKEYWGKGYGPEAADLLIDYGFNQLNLHRISSGAIEYNKRSIKMHGNLGFKTEGIQKKAIFKKGQFCDKILFGLLRENWRK